MAGINAPAVKRALITALQALQATTLAGVAVSYSHEIKLAEQSREYIYLDPRTVATGTLSAMQGSARVKREESANLALRIRVSRPGEVSTEDAEERAAVLGVIVENYLAANPTIGDIVLKAVVAGYELTSFADETGAWADIDYALTFHSYLT